MEILNELPIEDRELTEEEYKAIPILEGENIPKSFEEAAVMLGRHRCREMVAKYGEKCYNTLYNEIVPKMISSGMVGLYEDPALNYNQISLIIGMASHNDWESLVLRTPGVSKGVS
jgi:hypothetical protein